MFAVEIVMYLMLFIVPAILFIVGTIMKKKTPKKINGLVGYRTARSMASQEAWDYANARMAELSGRSTLYSLVIGVIGLIALIIADIPTDGVLYAVIVSVIMLLQAMCVVIPTLTVEKELKNEVYKNRIGDGK